MEQTQQKLSFRFNARYSKLGEINEQTKEVWYVLHGYGQLAQYFVRKFKPLSEKGICVIAPEGLSRFYLQGNQGRVGATWMTKENRLMDIENYTTYLDSIHQKEIGSRTIKTTLFGFSQGAATVMRWVMNNQVRFDRMVLWAGLFPPDIDFTKGAELLKGKQIIEVLGKRDEFIDSERIQEMMKLNQQLNIDPTILEFEGKHELNDQVLKSISEIQY
jgi:predicted esterase